MRTFHIIAAIDSKGGIGIEGKLPWKIPSEMQYFKRITSMSTRSKKNAVIMGRKTWESIPEKYRPLEGRLNIVVSRDLNYVGSGALAASSLDDALLLCDGYIEDVFVIGGAELYSMAVKDPRCESLYLSIVNGEYDCDKFFPSVGDGSWHRVAAEDFPGWKATVYVRRVEKRSRYVRR